jgi:integrase
MRRIALDKATVDILTEHRKRCEQRCADMETALHTDAYVFSYAADNSRPCNPDTLTHRYSAMTAKLGLDTHLHELRHYSATELLAAGVDLRTVAGRLGHGGGGATTLKVYAAWVQSADEQAAELLASRLPNRPGRRGE